MAQELRALGYAVAEGALAPVTLSADPLSLKRAVRDLVIDAATHGKAARPVWLSNTKAPASPRS